MVPEYRQVEGVRGLESRSLLDWGKFFTLESTFFTRQGKGQGPCEGQRGRGLTMPVFPVRELLASSVRVGSAENQGELTMYTRLEKPTHYEELQFPSQAGLMITDYGTRLPTAGHWPEETQRGGLMKRGGRHCGLYTQWPWSSRHHFFSARGLPPMAKAKNPGPSCIWDVCMSPNPGPNVSEKSCAGSWGWYWKSISSL